MVCADCVKKPAMKVDCTSKRREPIRVMGDWITRLSLCALLAVAGCGDDDTAGLPQSLVADVDAGGATLELRSAEGGTLTLTLPPGALEQATRITVDSLPQEPGTLARFRIAPAGLKLLAQATLHYAAPAALPGATVLRWRVGDERFALPSSQQGNAVQAKSFSLGHVFAASSAPLASRDRREAARARPAADGDPPTNELEVGAVDCDAELERLRTQFNGAVQVNDIVRAQALFEQAQAVLLACQQRDIADLQRRACSAYASAALTAQSIAADSYTRYRELVTPLMLTQADVQLTDARCSAPDMDGLMRDKFDQFQDFIEADYARPGFAADFDTTRAELRHLFEYQSACQLMGLDPACARFGNSLLPAVLDAMRAAAYRECRANGELSVLSQMYAERIAQRRIVQGHARAQALARPLALTGAYLTHARYDYADLEADLAHCRSTLQLSVFDDALTVPVEFESRRTRLQADDAPGQHDTLASVSVPRGGSLNLAGGVRTLQCPDGSVSADEIVARVNGVRLAARPANGRHFAIENNPFDLVVANVLTQAGLDAQATPEFTVELFREGEACAGLFSGSFKLYAVRVLLNPVAVSVTPATATVAAGGTLRFSAAVSGSTDPGVRWTTSAGSISADGLLSAPATAGTVLTVTATSVADTRASASASVTVGSVPADWVGTVEVTLRETFRRTETIRPVFPSSDKDTFTLTESRDISTTTLLDVEVRGLIAGQAKLLTVLGSSGSGALANDRLQVQQQQLLSPETCLLITNRGQTVAATMGNFTVFAPRLQLNGDASYDFFASDARGLVVGSGSGTQRDFSITSRAPSETNPCGQSRIDLNFDRTEARSNFSFQVGMPRMPATARTVAAGVIEGSATETTDFGFTDLEQTTSNVTVRQSGSRVLTLTWTLRPRP